MELLTIIRNGVISHNHVLIDATDLFKLDDKKNDIKIKNDHELLLFNNKLMKLINKFHDKTTHDMNKKNVYYLNLKRLRRINPYIYDMYNCSNTDQYLLVNKYNKLYIQNDEMLLFTLYEFLNYEDNKNNLISKNIKSI